MWDVCSSAGGRCPQNLMGRLLASDICSFENIISHLAFNWWFSIKEGMNRLFQLCVSMAALGQTCSLSPCCASNEFHGIIPNNINLYNCKFTKGNDWSKFSEVNSSEFTSAGWEMCPCPWKLSDDSSTDPFCHGTYYFPLKWFCLVEKGSSWNKSRI